MVVIFELGPEGRLLAFISPLTFLAGYNQLFTVEDLMASHITSLPNH